MVNKVILVGNLGKDPELRYTPSGTAVASFSIATSEKYKDRDGKQHEKTEWHNIVAWRQLADNISKYLTKGSKIYLEGKLQTRSYDDKDGNKRYVTEIVADQVRFLDGAQGSQNRPAQQESPAQQRDSWESSGFNPNDEIPF